MVIFVSQIPAEPYSKSVSVGQLVVCEEWECYLSRISGGGRDADSHRGSQSQGPDIFLQGVRQGWPTWGV